MEGFRDGDVVSGDEFGTVVQPTNGGLLNGQVVEDMRVADQAGGGGAGVRNDRARLRAERRRPRG